MSLTAHPDVLKVNLLPKREVINANRFQYKGTDQTIQRIILATALLLGVMVGRVQAVHTLPTCADLDQACEADNGNPQVCTTTRTGNRTQSRVQTCQGSLVLPSDNYDQACNTKQVPPVVESACTAFHFGQSPSATATCTCVETLSDRVAP
jgi:hypothetical protein